MIQKECGELISYLHNNIPFYNEKINEISAYDDPLELFGQLPIIDKKDIRHRYMDFIKKEIAEEVSEFLNQNDRAYDKDYNFRIGKYDLWIECTSGSTGIPFSIVKSRNERIRIGRNIWRLRNNFAEISPKAFFSFMHNREGGYAFPFDEIKDCEKRKKKELNYLINNKYKWWHIYPKQLDGYCQIMQKNNIDIPSLEVIECNGAFISDTEKQGWEKIFKCKIANNYGNREVWTIAYTCKCGNLHVNEDSVFLEIIDDDGNIVINSDVIGNVVVTSKYNMIMPFVRYKTGDFAIYKKNECACGKTSPIIEIIPNRQIIIGTNINGNTVFRSVINNIVLWEKIRDFYSINVIQNIDEVFKVYVKGYNGNKAIFENAFTKWTYRILDMRINLIYIYDSEKEFKSLFSIGK